MFGQDQWTPDSISSGSPVALPSLPTFSTATPQTGRLTPRDISISPGQSFGVQPASDKSILARYKNAEPVTKAQMELCLGKLEVFLQQFKYQADVDVLNEEMYAELEAVINADPGTARQYLYIQTLANHPHFHPNEAQLLETVQCADVILTYIAQSTNVDTGCPEGSWSTAAYWEEYSDLAEKEPCVEKGKCPQGFELSELGGEFVCSYKEATDATLLPKYGYGQAMTWWNGQSTAMKIVYGGGLSLGLFLLIRSITRR